MALDLSYTINIGYFIKKEPGNKKTGPASDDLIPWSQIAILGRNYPGCIAANNNKKTASRRGFWNPLSGFWSKGGTVRVLGIAGVRRLDFDLRSHAVIALTIIMTAADHTFYSFKTIILPRYSSFHASTSFITKSFFSMKTLPAGYSVIIRKMV